MAVTLIDEIRAAEKTAEEIREAAVDEAREIAKRAQAALAGMGARGSWENARSRGTAASRGAKARGERGARH